MCTQLLVVHTKSPITLGGSGTSLCEKCGISSSNSSLTGDIFSGNVVKEQCLHAEVTVSSHQKLLAFFFCRTKRTVPHLTSSRSWEGIWPGEPAHTGPSTEPKC